MAIKTRLGAQRYNNRMDKIFEKAKRLEAERLKNGEQPNPNLTETRPKYYHLHDLQLNTLMATGRNSRSKEEAKTALLSYLSADHEDDELEELAKLPPDELASIYEFEIIETDEPEEENF